MEIFIVKREKHRREKAERPKTLIGFEQTCPHISAQPPAALKGLLDKELEEVERPVKGEKLVIIVVQEKKAAGNIGRPRKGIDVAGW